MTLLADRYQLLGVLGSGGMGTVWRAYDLRERRCVALKVLREADAGTLACFVREQAVHIEHPHVAAPLAWVEHDGQVAFTLDLARGGSLHDLLCELRRDGRRVPAPWAVELIDQLLDGLVAVHAVGLVHRDLKPANLLLEPTGRGRPLLRIGDFGVATSSRGARLTRCPGAVGTPGFAAPEQLRGAVPDPTMDLYAVGVIASMLLGRPGRLAPLLDSLRATSPGHRPASAEAALCRLRTLREPWSDDVPADEGPDVRDRLGPARVPGRTASIAATCCLASSTIASAAAAAAMLTGLSPMPW